MKSYDDEEDPPARAGGLVGTWMPEPLDTPREAPHQSVPWVYLSTVIFFLAGALFYLYLARLLSPTDLGSVVILLGITTLVSSAFSFGLGPGVRHFLSFSLGRDEPDSLQRFVRSALVAAAVLGAAASVTTVALSSWLGGLLFHDPSFAGLIGLGGVFAGLSTALTILRSVLLGLQRFVAYSVLHIAGSALTYGLPIAFLALWPDLHSIVLGWIAGTAVGCALFLVPALRRLRDGGGRSTDSSLRPVARTYRMLLSYSLPLFAYSVIATGATYIDRLVLASLADLASVGIYNYAILVATGSTVVIGPFSTILIPKLSERFGRGDRDGIRMTVRTATTLVVLVYVPLAVALAAMGPILLQLLAGKAFVAASGPMAIVLVLTAVAVPYTVVTSLAAGVQRTRVLALGSAFAVGANTIFSILLVPRLGAVGAALGNSTMGWGLLLILFLGFRGTGLLSIDWRAVGLIWASAAVLGVVIGIPLLLLGYPLLLLPPLVAGGAAALFVTLRLTRAVPPEVREFSESVLPPQLRFLRPAIRWLAPGEPMHLRHRSYPGRGEETPR